MYLLLDGKKIAQQKTKELRNRVNNLQKKPILCIVQVGDLFESNKYIKNKIKKANELNILTKLEKLNIDIKEEDLITFIQDKIKQKLCDGLIVQLPLPNHINKQNVLDAVELEYDIDGLSSNNMNNFYNDKDTCFIPATSRAIMLLLNFYKINLTNKNIVVVGESNLVGKPTKHILSKYTSNISSRNIKTGIYDTNKADILVVAAGSPFLIKENDVKKNSVIIDVGINTLDNNKVVGDVDFESVKNKVFAISPTPGGVGPLTVISLLENLIEKCEKIEKNHFNK